MNESLDLKLKESVPLETNETIKLAERLIACPSLTPNDAGCLDIITDYLKQHDFVCEKMVFGDVQNLWAKKGNTPPLVVFAGHTDVVPTGPLTDWASPPFEPTKIEGHLYGRGATDMKGALASMVIASDEFLKAQPNFKGTIAFLLTSDEEGEAINGTQKVIQELQKRGEKIDYCIIGEPSSISELGDQIRIGRRGSLHGKLAIHGKQGHVAHPHLAVNPIHLSMHALHELQHTEWDNGNNEFPPTSFQITNIHGGTGATNVVPGHLEVLFNFRHGNVITIEDIKIKTESILNKIGLKYDLAWKVGGEPFLTKRGKLIEATQAAIKEVTGQTTKLSTGGGTSDGRFIAPTGAEVVELGVSHATAHHVNENAKMSDLENLTKIYVKILSRLLG